MILPEEGEGNNTSETTDILRISDKEVDTKDDTQDVANKSTRRSNSPRRNLQLQQTRYTYSNMKYTKYT